MGLDMDGEKLELARRDADARGLDNIEFRASSVYDWREPETYDLVYSRNVLQHLSRRSDVIDAMWTAVRPGGVLAAEDADFGGLFCEPDNDGWAFFARTYQSVLSINGGDPLSGRRLFRDLLRMGAPTPHVRVVQSADSEGDGKTVPLLTLLATADAIVGAGLATRDEVDAAADDLSAFMADRAMLVGSPRIFQVWTRKG